MSDGRLVFTRPDDGTGRLIFGDEGGSETPATEIGIDADFGDDMPASVQLLWDANVSRVLTAFTRQHWEDAATATARTASHWQESRPIAARSAAHWQDATTATARTSTRWQDSRLLSSRSAAHWQDAAHLRHQVVTRWQDELRLRSLASTHWQDAPELRHLIRTRWQEQLRLRALNRTRWQDATPLNYRQAHRSGAAKPVHHGISTRWQDARHPLAGESRFVPPDPPTPEPCYDPETLGQLVFTDPWANDGRLVFLCIRGGGEYPPETIIVPIRNVYMTVNNFTLFRVDTSQVVPATALSLNLDVDSWTWNCSFALQGAYLPLIRRAAGEPPVVLQTSINGTPIRFMVEKIGRDRTFGSSLLRAQGRGIAAELDEPFAPVLSFGNTSDRMAAQLLNDILTFNGVSIGWDFGATAFTDWLVPAGVFSHTGTYISALNAVAGSIGAYVQPHNTNKQLDVLMRYPTPSWEWAAATPDIVLPSAVTTQEGIDWVDKPDYNRVYVHGQEGGVNGRYTRAGTAGDILAPSVVDPLITHVDAVRQRGRTVISDTGRIANVTLRLPVLAETGIIKPGRLIEYTDGPVSRIGMSRSVAIDVTMPTIYQTILVETHGD